MIDNRYSPGSRFSLADKNKKSRNSVIPGVRDFSVRRHSVSAYLKASKEENSFSK
jgi:hypothetical protein